MCDRAANSLLFCIKNNSRKNEGMESKQKQHPVVNGTGDGSKVWCCKEQYCIGTWNASSMNQGKLKVVNFLKPSLVINAKNTWSQLWFPFTSHCMSNMFNSLVNAAPKIYPYSNTSDPFTAPSMVQANIISHLDSCSHKRGLFFLFCFSTTRVILSKACRSAHATYAQNPKYRSPFLSQ